MDNGQRTTDYSKMLYQEQNWPAIDGMDKNTPVVVPLGSLEQHGHHLPTATDTLQVEAIAQEAERKSPDDFLLLPALWLGSSDHHIDFPGTVSVSGELYSRMIRSIARCLLRAGFTKILFLNGHGGNSTPISQALSDLCNEDDQADAAYLMLANWWGLCRDAIAPAKLGMKQPGINHACEYETSLMLHLYPQWVNASLAVDRPPVLDSEWTKSGKVAWFARFSRRTAAGATGYPTLATKEKGEQIFDAAVADLLAFIHEFKTWKPLARIGPE